MRTVILYKVLYIDNMNCYQEVDFETMGAAQSFANTVNVLKIIEYKLLEEITILV